MLFMHHLMSRYSHSPYLIIKLLLTMKSLLLVAAVCLAVTFCHAEDFTTPAPSPPLFNDRLDEIIRNTISKHRSEISPYRAEDQKVGFFRKVGPINMTGEVGFTNITIHGLENIRRIHDAYLETLPSQDVKLMLHLAIGPLELHNEGKVKFLGIGPRIASKVGLAHANGKAVLVYNHKVERVSVESFEVSEIVGLKFKILRSPGFVTPFIATQIVNGALAVFNPIVKAGVTRAGNTIMDYMVRDSDFVKDLMTEAYRP